MEMTVKGWLQKSQMKEKKICFYHSISPVLQENSPFYSHMYTISYNSGHLFVCERRCLTRPPQGNILLPSASQWWQLELNPAGLCKV